jgi:adenylate kinase family enzyme
MADSWQGFRVAINYEEPMLPNPPLPDLSEILGQLKFPRHDPVILIRRPPFTANNRSAMELLSRRTRLPYFNITEVLRLEVRAKSAVGLAVEQFVRQNQDPPAELIISVAALQLGSRRFSQGAIIDELPETMREARLLAQFLGVRALVELGAPDDHLLARAKEHRQCLNLSCRKTYKWRRKPADRVQLCSCGVLAPPLEPRTPPEKTVDAYRLDTTALAEFYGAKQVPHVVVNADNDVPEDELLTAVEAAITTLPPTTQPEERSEEPPGEATASEAVV